MKVETKVDGTGTVVPAQNVISGGAVTGYAISRDASGNFVANVAATWSLAGPTGGVVSGDLVPAVGDKSATFTGHLLGTAAMHAVVTGLTSTDSGTLTVLVGGAATLVKVETKVDGTGTVVPAQNVISGGAVTGYAISRDASGNFVANVAATWSLASPTGGVVGGDLVPAVDNKSATFTGHLLGTAAMHAVVTGLTSTDSGTLTVNVLAVMSVNLNPAMVTGGTTSNGTVTLNAAAPAGGVVVTLASSNPAVATVPASVTVAANTSTATFTVNTQPVAGVTPVTITATHNGSANGNLSVNPPSSFNPIRVNSAGSAYTDPQGRVWSADTGFSGGTVATVSGRAIANTVDDVLYQSERWGPFTYTFTVPAGSYLVTLKFAETAFTSGAASGQRVFNVAINGTTVLTNFDIKATAGGANIAVDRTFAVNAGAGSNNLVIQFIHVAGQPDDPKVDAIEIVSGGVSGPGITTQPANQTVTAGQTATFTVVASGTAPLSYQWRKDGVNISGATSASYTTPATVIGDNGSTFDVLVSNSVGGVISNTATLTVIPTYSISGTISPSGSGATVTLSGAASASTTADGSGNYSFAGWLTAATRLRPARAASRSVRPVRRRR